MKVVTNKTLILFVFTSLVLMMQASCSQAVDEEVFTHKSPDFTLTVPKWILQKPGKADVVLKRLAGSDPIPEILVTVGDLLPGTTYQNAAIGFQKGLERQLGSAVEILYSRDIQLKDGTPAREIELKWKYGMLPAHSYIVIAFKDRKIVWVGVSDKLWIGESLKKYPLSLTFK